MTLQELYGIWNYYLSLENDLANTSQYIEPVGQEDVHSFEFAKILILSCTETESVFKLICSNVEGKKVGDMGEYKRIILGKYPKITEAVVSVARLGRLIKPFEEWAGGRLSWWDAYQKVKHNRGSSFELATYINATYAIAALYVSIFYLAAINNLEFIDNKSQYLYSSYSHQLLSMSPPKKLPDFEDDVP